MFVEIDSIGNIRNAGYAPYLDYRPLTDEERSLVTPVLEKNWLNSDLEQNAVSYAITNQVPKHFQEIKDRTEEIIKKTYATVKDRLTKEITYWITGRRAQGTGTCR
jgi:hypothetical protein